MGYTMIFATKIVNLSDGRIVHFDRSGCNNDDEGRKPNDWTAKVYTEQEFKKRIESFKKGSKPYKDSLPHEWEIKIYGRMATGYDYGVHLERMQKRARNYIEFIAENEVRVNRCDAIEIIDPEPKTMTFNEFDEYRKSLPYDSKLKYRIWYTKLDLDKEYEFVNAIESGAPLEIYIGDRVPIQNMIKQEQENTGMTMSM